MIARILSWLTGLIETVDQAEDCWGDLCVACDERPPRHLPDPIPEGMEVMWSESISGRALYCEKCWEATTWTCPACVTETLIDGDRSRVVVSEPCSECREGEL